MKFTDGYWLVKPEYRMDYAVETYRMTSDPESMTVLAPARHVGGNRGATVDGAALTIRFSSPLENILRVTITHHKGAAKKPPQYPLFESPVAGQVDSDEQRYTFTAGRVKAVVARAENGFEVSYYGDGKKLTTSGFRGMAHATNTQTDISYMIDSLTLDVGEKVYGLGERFTQFVKNGQVVDTWNSDGGTASERAYKTVPFYLTNRGYGVFVESPDNVSYEVASEKVERVQFSIPGETMTYDVIYGETPKGVLERYTALTGRPALPPAWSFGLWLTTSFTTSYDEKTVSELIGGMDKWDIPLHVFHFDCFWMQAYRWCDFEWDKDVFPDPKGMLQRLKARGLRICVWLNSYIAQDSPLFDEAASKGYLIMKRNGDVFQTDMWQAGMGILDVTNPDARKWYQGFLEKLCDMGVDCFKTDFGERIPTKDIVYFDGSDPEKAHNFHAYLYNQMVFEVLERKRGKGEAVLFARSATAGCQQFPAHWGGDNSANYLSMAETLRAGLSLSMCGFGFWSHDISGFEQTAPWDVYKRWVAFGMLSSHSRLHGSASYRVPWLFGEESCHVLKKFSALKCSLMPYLYQAAVESHRVGTPVLRPMVLEFSDDKSCDTLETQYMLGGSLLIAPVFHEDGHVDYYLPEGRWTNLLSGECVTGGCWRHETHDFMSLPLMVRPDTVLPIGANERKPDYDYEDGVTLHLFEPTNGEKRLSIPKQNGEEAASFTLTVSGDSVQVQTHSKKPYKVILHRDGQAKEI